jgi:hypothetical protein
MWLVFQSQLIMELMRLCWSLQSQPLHHTNNLEIWLDSVWLITVLWRFPNLIKVINKWSNSYIILALHFYGSAPDTAISVNIPLQVMRAFSSTVWNYLDSLVWSHLSFFWWGSDAALPTMISFCEVKKLVGMLSKLHYKIMYSLACCFIHKLLFHCAYPMQMFLELAVEWIHLKLGYVVSAGLPDHQWPCEYH